MLEVILCLLLQTADGEVVGKRPYELDWAGRHADHGPPLVDFEDLEGWTVECRDSVARLERTREQQIWDLHVGKLTYRGAGPRPRVIVRPPSPIPVREPFDAVTLWVYGNNWGWAPDPKTPQVSVGALVEDASGDDLEVPLWRVDWTEWNLLHRRLSPAEVDRVRGGARLKGIVVDGGTNAEDRTIYLDNLVLFVEEFPPLAFEPRPLRGIPMFPGQTVGTNTGPERLPFPTRPETILPANLATDSTSTVAREGDAFAFTYRGPDGTATYRLEPRTGTLADISVRWEGRGAVIRPCVGGGVFLAAGREAVPPREATHLGTRIEGDAIGGHVVTSRWSLCSGPVRVEVAYGYRLWGKSLVVDVVAPGGSVAEVRYGRAEGLEDPRLVTVPFYLYGWGAARPAVAVSGPASRPLFLMGNTDWCLSNASVLFAENAAHPADGEAAQGAAAGGVAAGGVAAQGGVVYNGGARYIPRTDGRRNDAYERIFITLSPRFEEVLPTIPNPPSPWKHVAGTRVWRAHGASDRKRDADFWRDCRRHGMTQVVVTDHETGWRDGGESFTFRTRAAPGKGGDEGQHAYARLMQDEFGFVYGPYNNFTDFAPVNGHWSFDLVSRTPDSQLQHAWMRCYAPKPARAVEFCARLAPEIQRKFKFSTAYCDVHTAVAPWDRTDYDARVPGAGTFSAVFFSFGEIMLHQKAAWKGPVYSEGSYHYLYAGLTDGNYGQDNPYRPWKNPWLVDFDLLKIHDLCANFGMGNLDMFYGGRPMGSTRRERDESLDRFLAATVAFGHSGFLVYEGGTSSAMRSYFMLQALHARYCLASAAEIRYADAGGRLLATSQAVASGAYRRSQVVTRYRDGTVTAANGSPTERLIAEAYGRAIDLPPNGYAGWTADGAVEVLAADADGVRFDHAVAPDYVYIDGRGRFVRRPRAASAGLAVCRTLGDGRFEIIPLDGAEAGFALCGRDGAPEAGARFRATAIARDGSPMGPAALRVARGLTYVVAVDGAMSYLLEPAPHDPPPHDPAPDGPAPDAPGPGHPMPDEPVPRRLTSDRDRVVPGESVLVRGRVEHGVEIPADARPGQRIWREIEGGWIDFTVVPPADVRLDLDGDTIRARIVSRLAREERFEVLAGSLRAERRIAPGTPETLRIDLGPARAEADEALPVLVVAGPHRMEIPHRLRASLGTPRVADLPDTWRTGVRLRGAEETAQLEGSGAYAHPTRQSSGGIPKDCMAMHPPYRTGVGYAFVVYDPVTLPASPPAALRAAVGKGDGSDPGDGITHRVAVLAEDGAETVVAERRVEKHEWLPVEADLSRWAGETVRIKLIADVGEADDSVGDWGAWADLRIETRAPTWVRTLDPAP